MFPGVHLDWLASSNRDCRVFFTKFLVGWGGLLSGTIFRSLSGTKSDGRDSRRGRSQMRGIWKNCPSRPKMPPYSRIRANFGVLSIKYIFVQSFLLQF